MRSLTIAAMCAAGLASSVGFSGSTHAPSRGPSASAAHGAPGSLGTAGQAGPAASR